MPKIHDISVEMKKLRKKQKKLQEDFPHLYSDSEKNTIKSNEKLLNNHIQILLNYISEQKCDNENKKILLNPLKSILQI